MNIRLSTNEVIICPICFSDLTVSDEDFFCNNCRKKFPIINNVGVLVPSPDDHLSDIDEKMKGKTKVV